MAILAGLFGMLGRFAGKLLSPALALTLILLAGVGVWSTSSGHSMMPVSTSSHGPRLRSWPA